MTRNHPRASLSLVWLALLVVLLCTDPTRLPIPLLILPFGLLFFALYLSLKACFARYTSYQEGRIKRLAAGGATIGVVAFALHSLGQLTSRDIIVTLAIITVGYFYIGRTRGQK